MSCIYSLSSADTYELTKKKIHVYESEIDHTQNVLLVSHATPPGFLLSWRGRDRESSGEIESKQQKERARDRRPRRERERNQVRRGWRGGKRWVREKKTWQHFRWAFPPFTSGHPVSQTSPLYFPSSAVSFFSFLQHLPRLPSPFP